MLHYLSVAMKMPADGGEAADAQPHDDSAPASEAAGEASEHVVKSPKKKSRRRFQPKRSPKKKAKKSDSSDNCWTAYASAFKDSSKGHLNFRRAGLIYIYI